MRRLSPEIDAVLFAASDEGAKLAGEDVVMEREQVPFIELERHRKLLSQLPDAVDELRKDRRHLLRINSSDQSAALRELMAERQPLLLDQRLHQ